MQPNQKRQKKVVNLFCRERLTVQQNYYLSFDRIYPAYKKYCNARNEIPLEKTDFFEYLDQVITSNFAPTVYSLKKPLREGDFVFFCNLYLEDSPLLAGAKSFLKILCKDVENPEQLSVEDQELYSYLQEKIKEFEEKDI
jgi:hypothetical protein